MTSLAFVPQPTADGSFTFFSSEFGEAFHSLQGARLEAEQKFVGPTKLCEKAAQGRVRLLDVCYGLGYNTAAALQAIWRANPSCYVEWIGLERSLQVPQAAIAHGLLAGWDAPIPTLLDAVARRRHVNHRRCQGQLLLGDARQTIQQVSLQADAVFLDPFSPRTCPELWTVEFLQQIVGRLGSGGYLATYSCAAAARTAILSTGLHIGSTPGVGRKSPGTVAGWTPVGLTLSPQEEEHLQTRAAIPYRDPTLGATAADICQRREQEQAASQLESTSRWRKRWHLY